MTSLPQRRLPPASIIQPRPTGTIKTFLHHYHHHLSRAADIQTRLIISLPVFGF